MFVSYLVFIHVKVVPFHDDVQITYTYLYIPVWGAGFI